MKTIEIKITLLEDILGTLPSNPEIYSDYIAKKEETAKQEVEQIKKTVEKLGDDLEEKTSKLPLTIFVRDDDGNPCIYDYLVKGFFKNACKAMRLADGAKSKKLTAYKTKIDNLVFVEPRMIKLETDEPISYCERPLRASTAQGERVALSASESLPAGTTLKLTISVLSEDMLDYIYEWLDYGKFNGLGQWHNSGKGRFSWELIDA